MVSRNVIFFHWAAGYIRGAAVVVVVVVVVVAVVWFHAMSIFFPIGQLDSSDEQTAVIRRELDNRLKIADQLQRVISQM